jgi:hypothetical protein
MCSFISRTPKKHASNYRRDLDLQNALASVEYDIENVRYTHEVFSSHPANVIAAKLTASSPGSVSFDLRLQRRNHLPDIGDLRQYDSCLYMDSIEVVDGCLVMEATTGGEGVHMVLAATVCVDGGEHDHLWESNKPSRIIADSSVCVRKFGNHR